MTPTLFIRPHLGAGDAIILNALVRHFANKGPVIFPCKHHNILSVSFMFHDDPNITVIPVTDDAEADRLCAEHTGEVLRLGMFGDNFSFKDWSSVFYRQAGLNPDLRWSGFRVGREWGTELCSPEGQYAFVHEDRARKMIIRDELLPQMPIIYAEKREDGTIFNYMGVIEYATEIHCIDSCMAILSDQVRTKARRLVMHRYARPNSKENGYAGPPVLRKPWEVIQ
jgi:hypothetical protein